MNEKPTNSSSKDLSGRTVAIIFSAVGAIFIIVCLAVGAWPVAVGGLITILLFPVAIFFCNYLGWVFVGIPILLLGRLCSRILPNSFVAFAANQKLHPVALMLPFLGLFGILLFIFKDFVAVVGVLMTLGLLFGLPALANWFFSRRKNKRPVDQHIELGK